MGKKRVNIYEFNKSTMHADPRDDAKNHRKNKPEGKLLHTLNSHFKKLAKTRTKICMSSSPSSSSSSSCTSSLIMGVSCEKQKQNRQIHQSRPKGSSSCCMGGNADHDHAVDQLLLAVSDGECIGRHVSGVFYDDHEMSATRWSSFLDHHSDKELETFDIDHHAFAPDLMNIVGGEAFGLGSYLTDPSIGIDDVDQYSSEMLELSSQDDMIEQFLKVDLFYS